MKTHDEPNIHSKASELNPHNSSTKTKPTTYKWWSPEDDILNSSDSLLVLYNSPQSISAPPSRLRRSRPRTARATPSQKRMIRAAPAGPSRLLEWRGDINDGTFQSGGHLEKKNQTAHSRNMPPYCSFPPTSSGAWMRGVTESRTPLASPTCSLIRRACGPLGLRTPLRTDRVVRGDVDLTSAHLGWCRDSPTGEILLPAGFYAA